MARFIAETTKNHYDEPSIFPGVAVDGRRLIHDLGSIQLRPN